MLGQGQPGLHSVHTVILRIVEQVSYWQLSSNSANFKGIFLSIFKNCFEINLIPPSINCVSMCVPYFDIMIAYLGRTVSCSNS